VDKAKALSGLSGKAVRLKRITAGTSPLGAFGKALGLSEDGVRTLATLGAVMSDPKVQAVLGEANAVRLREQGALVLAPTPVR
jgi:protease-4